MRKNIVNKSTIEGRVYEHTLEIKQVKNKESANYGKDFIAGRISIATDEDCLNIVTVEYNYVAPTYKNGKENKTYTEMLKIIENGKTVVMDGKDNATMVKAECSLTANDFYSDRDGGELKLVTNNKIEGKFISIVSKLNADEKNRNSFEADVFMTSCRILEANPEKNLDRVAKIGGYVFAYNGAISPVEFTCKENGGINYFESLGLSNKNPLFTKIWGVINNSTIKVSGVSTIDVAFGNPIVKEYDRDVKEWVVTGAAHPGSAYPLNDAENGITSEEMTKAVADREVYLAGIKARKESSMNGSNPAGFSAKEGGFSF